MAEIKISGLKKVYPSNAVGFENVDLLIGGGEFTVILGDSASGKSALVRTICGLDSVTEGEISIDGTIVNDLQPKDRDIAIVVKSVGLYPNLNIFDNLSYGLKLRKMPKEEIEDRTYEVARILGLTDVLSRKPKNVTAIERQRTCIGRALARRPKIVILDDPFSDFNEETKSLLCSDILKLQKRSKINFIYCTRSPAEALALADKIVYMERGKVLSYATPEDLYDAPKTLSIARAVGEPPINLFAGKIEKANGVVFKGEGFEAAVTNYSEEELRDHLGTGKAVQLAVRAEDMKLGGAIEGTLEDEREIDDGKLLAFTVSGDRSAHYSLVESDYAFEKGKKESFSFDESRINLFDLETEINIRK